jgi:hypothetical protein
MPRLPRIIKQGVIKLTASVIKESAVKDKISDLAERANIVRNNHKLRHVPNEHDLALASENAKLIQSYQFNTIKT